MQPRSGRDPNHVTTLMAVDIASVDSTSQTPVVIGADPVTHRLLVSAIITGGGSSGTQYGETDTTSPATGTLALARYKATPPTLTDGQMYGLQVDAAGNLKVTGSLSVGGTTDNSAFTAGGGTGTPAMGFYHSTIDTVTDGRAAAVAITTKRGMHVNLRDNSGAEITTLPVSGTFWQATQPISAASLPLPSGAATSAKQPALGTAGSAATDVITIQGIASMTKLLVTPDSVALPANQSVNVSQINGVTPLMGNGVTGTGSQRVTIASDNTPFTVNASLAAETTKVIGVVRNADGSGNLLTSTGNALDINIKSGNPTTITANAGTNLNTSALALETGGNLATLAAVVSSSRAAVNPISGQAGVAGGAGASGATTQRIVQANDAGKTLVSTGGSVSSSGNNTLIGAGTNRLKIYAFSLSTVSSTAVTCIFQSGASGTELWRVVLQAPASVSTGANLVVQPPAWLFATASATLLNLNLSAAQTVHWAVSYFDEA